MIAERDATIAELHLRLTQSMAGDAAPNGDGASASAASAPTAALSDERRALERALVREGSSVLATGTVGLKPELSYAHGDAKRSLQLRSSQELVRERDGRPSLLGSLGYTFATRRDGSDGAIPLGSGHRAARAGLTATYRLDPLVVFDSASYEKVFPKQMGGVDVAPGNAVGLRLGSALAVSPRTSVSVAVSLGFPKATRIGGVRETQSGAPSGTLQFGLSTVLSPSMVINVGSEFRVMGSAPDLRLTLSLPIRY